MRKPIAMLLLIGAAALLTAGCANNKQPADQAITAADSAFESTAEDAKKFVPAQYNAVLGKLNALKVAYNKEKYDDVVKGMPEVQTAIKELTDVVAAKKEEEDKAYSVEWKTLVDSVPRVIGEVERQGESLEKSKKKPVDIDFVAARRYVAEAQTMWKQAQIAGETGKYEAAVVTAKKAQQRAEMAARYLRITLTKA